MYTIHISVIQSPYQKLHVSSRSRIPSKVHTFATCSEPSSYIHHFSSTYHQQIDDMMHKETFEDSFDNETTKTVSLTICDEEGNPRALESIPPIGGGFVMMIERHEKEKDRNYGNGAVRLDEEEKRNKT
ncbi:uncharacterized protein L201_007829 [Kwoniella dendrophila CBS 6074]|uniref:Uncharacterized protein n=1 Tax=Kwoniella dendrophila CBS 6074 TaxID=1295534 RepID=A0AAX4K700_9TREE